MRAPELDAVFEHGDHAVVIGRLEEGTLSRAAPLVYFERAYRRLREDL